MNRRESLAVLRCDIFRFRGSARAADLALGLLWLRTFRPIVTLRVLSALREAHWPGAGMASLFVKLLHRWFCAAAGIDLPHLTAVGPGFCITHGWGLVISPGARIGANCTLFHGVTIGQKDVIAADGSREIGYPVLEDECWIGPGACVLGSVRVGTGAIVGAGAVVVRDVPARAVVVGNPARVVRENATADVFNRARCVAE